MRWSESHIESLNFNGIWEYMTVFLHPINENAQKFKLLPDFFCQGTDNRLIWISFLVSCHWTLSNLLMLAVNKTVQKNLINNEMVGTPPL